MSLTLKSYQQRCLDELARYLRGVSTAGRADTPFTEQTGRPYYDVAALPGLPYVCVRVPTGGGKTLMAAHAVGIVTRELLHADRGIVLWLAPTTQIVEQTLHGLRDHGHAYRQALDTAFGGCVSVLDVGGALCLSRSMLDADTVVIVTTLAAMRVGETEGRKVYEANGRLMACFSGLTPEQYAVLQQPVDFDGNAPSLANLLRLRRPLVIVDEAHNARTPLSFDALARFNPACIVEFTATPQQDHDPERESYASNVLTHVSAAELKAEDMIKLPIRLRVRAQWTEAVREALDKQAQLERAANEERAATGEYVRPIVLFQAQRHAAGQETLTFERLKQALIESFDVPAGQIAIATGTVNELADRNVLDRADPVRFIITVDKLREGWDCPFAYILCSVSNLSSRTAVEQILGRVLRLPHATRKQHDELNLAYAFVTCDSFAPALAALHEGLIDSGFEKYEARTMVRPEQGTFGDLGPLFAAPVSVEVSTAPDVSALPDQIRTSLSVEARLERTTLTYSGPPIPREAETTLAGAFTLEADRQAVTRLCRLSRGEESYPAALGTRFAVPQLCVRQDGNPTLFDPDCLEYEWALVGRGATSSAPEFSIDSGPTQTAEMDVTREGRFATRFISELHRQLSFNDLHGPRNELELVGWLDRAFVHKDLSQAETSAFLVRAVQALQTDRGYSLAQLVASRFRLRDAVEDKIARYRREAKQRAIQGVLFDEPTTRSVETSPAVAFTFPLTQYPAPRLHGRDIEFSKHYYARPAEMNPDEEACALHIDQLREVKHWVRNLVREEYAFWLPTSSDKFYPDFVVELWDGRYLVVEFKNDRDWTNKDSEEKRLIGELWANRSGGRCIFVMPKGRDFNTIAAAVGARTS